MEENSAKLEAEMRTRLGSFGEHSKPLSISVVPKELHRWNKSAYTPKVVSIGPIYTGRATTRYLLQMERAKLRCVSSLMHRPQHLAFENLEACTKHISSLEKEVRANYVDDLKLEWDELSKIVLTDACFLLELLIIGSADLNENKLPSRLKPPGPGSEVVKREELLTDLMVLENQIPLRILRDLSQVLFSEDFIKDYDGYHNNNKVCVETLVLNLLGYFPDGSFGLQKMESASHILELVHSYVSREVDEESQHDGFVAIDIDHAVKLNRCATILQAAGVIIKRRGEVVKGRFNFDIEFNKSNRTLNIPPLHITKETEARWRNLIAWEQSQSIYGCKHKCTYAALFFNGLICCEGDVQILKNRKVIMDHLDKSNQQLLEFFRSMMKGVDLGKVNNSLCWKVVNDLNEYSAAKYCARELLVTLWHPWLPKLRRRVAKFFRGGYNVMGAIISLFTIVQGYYAVATYYYPRN